MARPGSTCPPPTLTRLGEEGTDRVVVGFRPEDVDLVSEHDEGAFPVDVALVEELGSDAFLYGTPAGSTHGTLPRRVREFTCASGRPGTLLLAGHRHPSVRMTRAGRAARAVCGEDMIDLIDQGGETFRAHPGARHRGSRTSRDPTARGEDVGRGPSERVCGRCEVRQRPARAASPRRRR
jgi:hypothetical protein